MNNYIRSLKYFKYLQLGCFLFLLLTSSVNLPGCKKLVEVESPITSITGETVYTTDATAISVLTEIYSKLSSSSFFAIGGLPNFSLFGSLCADDLQLYSAVTAEGHLAYFKNDLSTSTGGPEYWNSIYPLIFISNSAINGISNSTSLTPLVRQQLLGEALFIRAFLYFYLVNMYGDVPLVLGTDYTVNSRLKREPVDKIYEQVINDLKESQQLLSDEYFDATLLKNTNERVRPTKWAASALLARSYLYIRDWNNAEMQASIVINNNSVYDTVALKNVFLKNSKEAIWQLQPVNTGWNTEDGRVFVLTPFGPNFRTKPAYINSQLYNSFEPSDSRKNDWIGSITLNGNTYNFPYKYKIATSGASVTEYNTVFRLGELYLIRSEARAELGKILDAQSDLNVVRKRARLSGTTANDKSSLLAAILKERRVELFTEWGHRWMDLKRTGTADEVMSVATNLKGGTWEVTDKLFPIPQTEILANPNLEQNPGY